MVTDHANLKWLTTMAPQQAKVARWCLSIAEFDFFLEHRIGGRNIVAGVLSRHQRTFLMIMSSYLQRILLSHLSSSQPQLMFQTTPLNLSMEHLTILLLVYKMHVLCLKPMVLATAPNTPGQRALQSYIAMVSKMAAEFGIFERRLGMSKVWYK